MGGGGVVLEWKCDITCDNQFLIGTAPENTSLRFKHTGPLLRYSPGKRCLGDLQSPLLLFAAKWPEMLIAIWNNNEMDFAEFAYSPWEHGGDGYWDSALQEGA